MDSDDNGDDRKPPRSHGNSRKERMERKMAEFGNDNNNNQKEQDPRASNTSASAAGNRDDLQERMERKMAAFNPNNSSSSNNQQQAPSASMNSATGSNSNDNLRERMERKMQQDENDRNRGTAAAAAEDSITPLSAPASRRPRRNQQRPHTASASSNSNTASSLHSAASMPSGNDLLLEMSGSMNDVNSDIQMTGPVISVDRTPTHASTMGISTISSSITGTASAPLSQTTQVSKGQREAVSAADGGPTPGAYQIQGRAVGAVPAWVRRVGNNIRRGSMRLRDDETDQSHLPPEMRSNVPPEMRGAVAPMEAPATSDMPNVDFSLAPPPDDECPAPLPSGAAKSPEEEADQRRRKMWIIIIVIAVLLLAGVGAGVGVALSGGGGGDESANGSTEASVAAPTPAPTPVPPKCDTHYNNLSQAHQNCICAKSATLEGTLSDEVKVQYISLRTSFDVFGILTDAENIDEDSCEPNNVALYWLAEDIVKNDTPEGQWTDRYLLTSLFLSWTGDSPFQWNSHTSWLTKESACSWYGVICNSAGNAVERLQLSKSNLMSSGGMPKALFELKALKFIDLSFNDLDVSSIPNDIIKLQSLETLNLESNLVKGLLTFDNFPTSLVTFKMRGTSLSASIPTTVGLLSNLKHMDLHFSEIRGELPTEIGLLTQLTKLYLSGNNKLVGELPSEIGLLTALGHLDLRANVEMQLQLVTELGRLTNLAYFDSSLVTGFGTLPTELGLMTKLTHFHIKGQIGNFYDFIGSYAAFTGPIPSQIGLLSNLLSLDLSSNDLNGKIPSEIGQLEALEAMDFGNNFLTGRIPEEISNLTNLERLRLRGVVPGAGSSVEQRNALYGNFPDGLSALTKLTCFDAGGTTLTGTVPEGICTNNPDIFVNIRCAGATQCSCCSCDEGDACDG